MRVMVIGGAGFIGCNTARRFLQRGDRVLIVDNLARRGSRANLEWLRGQGDVDFTQCDIRDYGQLTEVFANYRNVDVVVHLAAQVAVTTSVEEPREDFDINALGTFNVLEAVRNGTSDPLLIFASTNKVYGGMEDIKIVPAEGAVADEKEGRYTYRDLPGGIPENRLLDFHSPYGCSKGAADQYVRDYARIYGIRSVVFRQSCIYGPRQFGIEDQGWVAWFTISAAVNRKLNIYGDGKQVRDMLHVDDLIAAYFAAIERSEEMNGRIFNIGGGPANTRSILGLVHFLERHLGRELPVEFYDWRPGDQPVYISDITKAKRELGWEPKIDPEKGVAQLLEWVQANQSLITEQLGDLLE